MIHFKRINKPENLWEHIEQINIEAVFVFVFWF